jgi:hypothetical protein
VGAFVKAAAFITVAVLLGCAVRHGAKNAAPRPTRPAASNGAAEVESAVVHKGRVDQALRLVAGSSLSQYDRAAFAAFMTKNRDRPEAYDGQTVRRIINYQRAYRFALKIAADSLARTRQARATLAKAITISPRNIVDRDRAITLDLSILNQSGKTITYAGAELVVADAAGSRTLGTTELHFPGKIAPHAALAEKRSVRYASFQSGNATMMDAGASPKRIRVNVIEVKYSDGTSLSAGEAEEPD